jgi:hypothetical protein
MCVYSESIDGGVKVWTRPKKKQPETACAIEKGKMSQDDTVVTMFGTLNVVIKSE